MRYDALALTIPASAYPSLSPAASRLTLTPCYGYSITTEELCVWSYRLRRVLTRPLPSRA